MHDIIKIDDLGNDGKQRSMLFIIGINNKTLVIFQKEKITIMAETSFAYVEYVPVKVKLLSKLTPKFWMVS